MSPVRRERGMALVLIAIYSFYSLNPVTGLMQQDFTWANYERVLTSPIYRNIFIRTLTIAGVILAAIIVATGATHPATDSSAMSSARGPHNAPPG